MPNAALRIVVLAVVLGGCTGGSGQSHEDASTEPTPDAELDAGSDTGSFGASRCNGAGLRFCEDFDDPSVLDGTIWKSVVHNGSLTIDSTHAARGGSALHVHVLNAMGNRASLTNTSLFSSPGWPGNHFFGRTFLWLEPAATAMHNGFITSQGPLLAPDGSDTGQTAVYGIHETFGNFVTHYSNSNAPGAGGCDCGAKSTQPIPVGHWACIEWEFDGPARSSRLWLDGTEVPSGEITPGLDWVAPRFDSLAFGFTMYHTSTDGTAAYDLWYDAFALDSARIGCDR